MELKPTHARPARPSFWRRLADIALELLEARANHYRSITPTRPPGARRHP